MSAVKKRLTLYGLRMPFFMSYLSGLFSIATAMELGILTGMGFGAYTRQTALSGQTGIKDLTK
jgi:hypothetical protein